MDERVEELLSLTIGEIREMLAYENAEDTFEKFLNDNGWVETDDNYGDDREEDYDDEDDESLDYLEEDEDSYWVEGSEPLDNNEEESLCTDIAFDISNNKYRLEDIASTYSKEMIDRIKYLIVYR